MRNINLATINCREKTDVSLPNQSPGGKLHVHIMKIREFFNNTTLK